MPNADYAAEPNAPSPPADEPPAPTWRSWAIAGAVVAVLAVAAVFFLGGSGDDAGTADGATAATDQTAAFPARGGAGPGLGARGTITSIEGSTITVESEDPSGSSTTTTVETTADTTVTESIEGSLDDLDVGDRVVAVGEDGDDGGLVASTISEGDGAGFGQGPGGPAGGFEPSADGELPEGFEPPADGELPEGFEPPADGEFPEGFEPPEGFDPSQGGGPGGGQGVPTAGEITAIDADTVTLDVDGESVTVTVVEDTTVIVTEERSLADLADGDVIVAVGETADDVLTATSIRLGDAGLGAFGDLGGGQPPDVPSDPEEG
ncbi:MAG: DUF5666 domain-containing protein [Acidimicrobiales bacterium]